MTDRSGALSEALERRAGLASAIERVEAALAAPVGRGGWWDDVRREVGSLRAAHDAHVDVTEGEGGLFSEVLDEAPRLAHQIDVLRSEHDHIAEAIGAVLEMKDDPSAFRDAATSVLGRIVRHRQKGADLLYEAYDVDVSALD